MLNYGSMMMAENFIYYLDDVLHMENEYYVEQIIQNTVCRLKQATGKENIIGVDMGVCLK